MSLFGHIGRAGESLCNSCSAACCRNMNVPLTAAEATWMAEGGSDISRTPAEKIPSYVKAPRGREFYTMVGNCGLLDPETNTCTAYNDPGRPVACSELKSGSEYCHTIREARAVPLPMPAVRLAA